MAHTQPHVIPCDQFAMPETHQALSFTCRFPPAEIVTCLKHHWFNPLAWWCVRNYDECTEWLCDNAALAAGSPAANTREH